MAWLYPAASAFGFGSLLSFGQDIANSLLGGETYCYQGVRTNGVTDVGASCFSVSSTGKFTKVFNVSDDSELAKAANSGYAMPGLWDGHGHLLQYGEFLNSVDLFGSTTLDEVRSRVRKYVEEHPTAGSAGEWIRGVGWDQMALGATPTAVSCVDIRP